MYDLKVINRIKDILVSRHQTLCVAESVTSGHIQAALSLANQATEFYQGGVTNYNLNQKVRILHIDAVHAMGCNCVSDKVANEMAQGVSKLFQTDWAIAITGYAAPVPELGIESLFAHFSVSHKGEIKLAEAITAEKDDPLKVQVLYTNGVLTAFLRTLEIATK
jgi:nicotinamide-nucleotide amidase